MERYLTTGIKAIIDDHPGVGDILERYHIACVPCTVGTCTLADVVKFHHLTSQHQAQLMWEVEKALYPDRCVPPPEVLPEEELPPPAAHRFSPPVRRLVEEHTWIKRLLAVLPSILEEIESTGQFDAALIRDVLDFIRGYADQFHHLKEEGILFDYVDPEEELVKVIYEDHRSARGHIREAGEAVVGDDIDDLCRSLRCYRELLTEHIDKEDGVLYPYIDRSLTTTQVGELFRRFDEADGQLEADVPERYERFIMDLESKYEGAASTSGDS